MITVYVQLNQNAEKCATFIEWTDRERDACQRLADRFKSIVRAFKNRRMLAEFNPKGNANSQAKKG